MFDALLLPSLILHVTRRYLFLQPMVATHTPWTIDKHSYMIVSVLVSATSSTCVVTKEKTIAPFVLETQKSSNHEAPSNTYNGLEDNCNCLHHVSTVPASCRGSISAPRDAGHHSQPQVLHQHPLSSIYSVVMDPIPSRQSLIKSRPYIGLAQSKVMLLLLFKELTHPAALKLAGGRYTMP